MSSLSRTPEAAAETFAPARVNPLLRHAAEQRVSLDGPWMFRLDPSARGLEQRWQENPSGFEHRVTVPGCWQGQGFGAEGEELIWDFRLLAKTFRASYVGDGWYAREFAPEAAWRRRRVWACFGGVHPSAEVWLNGQRLGENHLPFAPFGFEITPWLRWDAANLLVVRVHEEDRALGLAYNWQGNWSGLYRGVDLTATGQAFLRWVGLHADLAGRRLRVRAELGGSFAGLGSVRLAVSVAPASGGDVAGQAEAQVTSAVAQLDIPVASPRPWSPEDPNLYRVDVALSAEGEVLDAQSDRVGFFTLEARDRRFFVNGQPCFLRGAGGLLSCPETGSPDTDRDRWRRKLLTLREYGYNYVRCQSFVQTPEYLDAADEAGLLVQSEMGMLGAWYGQNPWRSRAWPRPLPAFRDRLRAQWNAVVARDASHPSACLYCMSNELPLSGHPRTAWRCARDTKALNPRALVAWTDGGLDESLPQDFVAAEAADVERTQRPVIQREFRWWSSFPDVRNMARYNGACRPCAAELAREAASRHGLAHILPQAAANSQRLQFIEAKGKLEALRRQHGRLAGVCHFCGADTNPSPQGILDEFYERKYATADQWRRVNSDTVILSSLEFDGRVLEAGGALRADLFVSDFGRPPFANPELSWRLSVAGKPAGEGVLAYKHEAFATCPAGRIAAGLPALDAPAEAALTARLDEGGRSVDNAWSLWVFPQAPMPDQALVYGQPRHTWLRDWAADLPAWTDGPTEGKVILAEVVDDALLAAARGGARVIVAAPEGFLRPFDPKLGAERGRYFFTPPANYPPYEDGHEGTIIQPHAMLAGMPHEGFADLQFYRLMADAPPMDLEPLGLYQGDPVIRAVHSYPAGRPLGYLLERFCGRGGFVFCALDLRRAWVEARWLFARLCAYAASSAFRPEHELWDFAAARLKAASED
ncbi:MAG TPA: glycoside hydrolase family 2 TIM barrel-domain containing protein [Candidatus Brocadiia bacterium]|nr:glycoside hydrolase family 2 TIM barrel-domain containing protein [Candidatus Brocadiia bacterium]